MAGGAAALKGLRVVEMGSLISVPFCGTLMGEFGAEVIKIEDPGLGDSGRYAGQVVDGTSLYFTFLNRNKKCITMDLRVSEGQELLKKLIPLVDVVVENFRAGTLQNWNLGYADLSRINPRLIMARVSGFGQYGPYRDWAAFDRIATAFAGQDYITGFPDKPPTHPGGALADFMAALFCTVGVMFAIYYRDVKGGRGQEIELGLYEGIFRVIAQVEEYDQWGIIPERTGNVNPLWAAAETFTTQDGQWVALHAGTENVWKRLVKLMGREDWGDDPKFQTARSRAQHRGEIDPVIAQWVEQFRAEEVLELLQKAGIPSTKVNTIADIFQDPHVRARENIVESALPSGRKIKTTGIVPKLSLTPGRVEFVAPPLGAHNEEIYRGLLHLSAEEYQGLKARGII